MVRATAIDGKSSKFYAAFIYFLTLVIVFGLTFKRAIISLFDFPAFSNRIIDFVVGFIRNTLSFSRLPTLRTHLLMTMCNTENVSQSVHLVSQKIRYV